MRGKSDRSGTRARYLRAIWSLTESDHVPVTITGLARALQHVPGSVSEQVKRLVGDGLIEHERYKSVSLTPEGRLEAIQVVRAIEYFAASFTTSSTSLGANSPQTQKHWKAAVHLGFPSGSKPPSTSPPTTPTGNPSLHQAATSNPSPTHRWDSWFTRTGLRS